MKCIFSASNLPSGDSNHSPIGKTHIQINLHEGRRYLFYIQLGNNYKQEIGLSSVEISDFDIYCFRNSAESTIVEGPSFETELECVEFISVQRNRNLPWCDVLARMKSYKMI